MRTSLRVAAGIIILGTLASCGDEPTGPNYGCKDVEINKALKRVFYWGTTDGIDMVPNVGYVSGGIDEPTWMNPTSIVVFTGAEIDNTWRRGIFKINIDEQTFAYKDYEIFDFPHYISSIAFQPNTGRLLLQYYHDGTFAIASVSLAGDQVVIDKELVGPEWTPLGVSPCGPDEDIVFYGHRSSDDVWGYFKRSWSGAEPSDSLLLNFLPDFEDDMRQKFAVDDAGRFLYFGATSYDDFKLRIMRLDLGQPSAQLDTLLTRSSSVSISIRPNPQDNTLLLIQYFSYGGAQTPPDGKIVLFDTETGAAKAFNVRTHETLCRFTTNENVFWSPDGENFTFSADAFDGEQGYYPRELWIYRNAR